MKPGVSTYAGFGRRFLALVIDWIILSLLSATLLLCAQWLPWFNYDVLVDVYEFSYWIQGTAILLILYCWLSLRSTPGKLLMGCRIVDAESRGAISVWQAIVRLLGYVLSLLPFCLGFFWIIKDKKRQGFHDKLARTVVVIEDESEKTIAQLAEEAR